jgi:hypothetical protein
VGSAVDAGHFSYELWSWSARCSVEVYSLCHWTCFGFLVLVRKVILQCRAICLLSLILSLLRSCCFSNEKLYGPFFILRQFFSHFFLSQNFIDPFKVRLHIGHVITCTRLWHYPRQW